VTDIPELKKDIAMTTNEETFLDVTARAVLTGFLSSGKLPEFNPKSLESLPEMSYLLAKKMWDVRSTYVVSPTDSEVAVVMEQVASEIRTALDLSIIGTETPVTTPVVEVKKKMGRPPKAKVAAPVVVVAPVATASVEKPAKSKWTRKVKPEVVAAPVAVAPPVTTTLVAAAGKTAVVVEKFVIGAVKGKRGRKPKAETASAAASPVQKKSAAAPEPLTLD